MSQPKTTSQKPSPPSAAERNFSSETYLPRHTPSMSTPPTFALRRPFSANQRFNASAPPGVGADEELRSGRGERLRAARFWRGDILKVESSKSKVQSCGPIIIDIARPQRPFDFQLLTFNYQCLSHVCGSWVHTVLS